MKQIFIGYVMICSLLLAVCGCSNDGSLQQGQNSGFPEESGKKKPDSSDKHGQNEPDLQDIEREGTGNNSDLTEDGPAEFLDFNLFSKREIHFNFSSPVDCVSCTITPHQEIDCIQAGKSVKVLLKENLELRTEFLVELNVIDNMENLLSIEETLFVNNWIPRIEINELYTESEAKKRAEFIEFKVKSAGNMEGLRLYIMWEAKKPYIFYLPAVDVKLGEYVIFHLRTLEDTCVNELGENLSESTGIESCPTARDLWVPGSTKWLHKTDIVYLQDASDNILDAIIMNEAPGETWNNSRAHFAKITEDLFNKGAWKSANGQPPGPFDAVDTSTIKSSKTKSVSRYERKENTHTAKDWYITAGGTSPGQPNK